MKARQVEIYYLGTEAERFAEYLEEKGFRFQPDSGLSKIALNRGKIPIKLTEEEQRKLTEHDFATFDIGEFVGGWNDARFIVYTDLKDRDRQYNYAVTRLRKAAEEFQLK